MSENGVWFDSCKKYDLSQKIKQFESRAKNIWEPICVIWVMRIYDSNQSHVSKTHENVVLSNSNNEIYDSNQTVVSRIMNFVIQIMATLFE